MGCTDLVDFFFKSKIGSCHVVPFNLIEIQRLLFELSLLMRICLTMFHQSF